MPGTTSRHAETFVDTALAQLRRSDFMSLPVTKIPDEMRDPAIPTAGDWIRWRPVASRVTDHQLSELETEYRITYPPLYRDFLKYRHFLALTEFGVRFESHPSRGWQDILRSAYSSWAPERIIEVGLIPLGDESFMDAGPVCMDTRLGPEDPPVIFWDHEWIGTEREIQPMFSSMSGMFSCLTFAARQDLRFFHHDPDQDDESTLSKKQALLDQFLALDPKGAGGIARGYWTCWGVDPGHLST